MGCVAAAMEAQITGGSNLFRKGNMSEFFNGAGVRATECVTVMQPMHKAESQSTQQKP
jgi:hypothetical protein